MSTVPAIPDAAPAESWVRGSAIRRWLREPLLHFLLLGAVLFAASRFVKPADRTAPSHQIVLTLDDLRQLQIGFVAQWERPPTPQEMVALMENRIREEILYREALAMGLDKDDTIVRRRMAQKMEFLAEDVAAAHEPTTSELKAWFEKNSGKFTEPGRASFRHLYFSPDKRPRPHDDAVKALSRLAGRGENWPGAAALADPFMFQDYYGDRTAEQLAKDFGPEFAKALFEQKPGSWQGPIASGFGWHLVWIDTLSPSRVPAFEEVEPDVKTAWLADQKANAWDKAYKAMRSKYELVLPAPPARAADSASPRAKTGR